MDRPARRLRTFRVEHRPLLRFGAACALATLAAGCTSEEPTAIDFSAGSGEATTTLSPHNDGAGTVAGAADDPNAEQRSMVFGLAEQQCLDDPELAQGIIQIAVPDTGEVVNEVSVDCGEVRARSEAGEPAGIELIPEELRPEAGE